MKTFGSTCVISTIRITSLHASITETDVTWTAPHTVLWSLGEVTCAIICACVPTLRPLLNPSYRPWMRRPYEANERSRSKGSSWFRRQRSCDLSNLDTQASVHLPATIPDDRVRGELCRDETIPKPSSCHLQDCGAESTV